MTDFEKIQKEAAENFLVFCEDDARPHGLETLQYLIGEALLKNDKSISPGELDAELTKSLTLKSIEYLLKSGMLYSLFSGLWDFLPEKKPPEPFQHCDQCISTFPVMLPPDEILRRIHSSWDNLEKKRISFYDCAEFLFADAPETRISPFIASAALYNQILKKFLDNELTAGEFADTFIHQYNIDAASVPLGNDPNNVCDTLLYELHKKRISYQQFCLCYYIRSGVLPENIPWRILLEKIYTDCLCHKMKDTSSVYYLDLAQLKTILENRFSEWPRLFEMINYSDLSNDPNNTKPESM